MQISILCALNPGRLARRALLPVLTLVLPPLLGAAFFWESFDENSFTQGPQRTAHSADGWVYAWFQPVDVVGGVFTGSPMRLRQSDGAPDPGFSFRGLLENTNSLLVLDDGKVLLSGMRGDAYVVLRTLPDGSLDPSFTVNGFRRGIRFMALQSDGKILLALADNVASNPPAATIPGTDVRLRRLHPDGRLDTSFAEPVFTYSFPAAPVIFAPLVVDAQDRIYVGGSFDQVNGVRRVGFARLLPSGALDTGYLASESSEQPIFSQQVRGIGLQPDGSAVVVGDFAFESGIPSLQRYGALRFDPEGRIDPDFPRLRLGPDSGIVNGLRWRAMVMDGDGAYYVVSDRLQRFLPSGQPDPGFGPVVFAAETFWLSRGPDGRIYLPSVASVNGEPTSGIAVLSSQGVLDTQFDPGGFGLAKFPTQAVVLGDGRVAVGGTFNRFGDETRLMTAWLSPNGELTADQVDVEAIFPGAHSFDFVDLAQGPQNTVYFLAQAVGPGDQRRSRLGRLLADGAIDSSFAPPAEVAEVKGFDSLAETPDGGVLLAFGGSAQAAVDADFSGLRKLLPGGSPDPAFMPPASLWRDVVEITRDQMDNRVTQMRLGSVRVVDVSPSGNMLVVFGRIDGSAQLLRLLPNGTLDTSFVAPDFGTITGATGFPGISDPVTGTFYQTSVQYFRTNPITAAKELPDGKVVVIGRFSEVGGLSAPQVVRLNADGSRDVYFNLPSGPANPPESWLSPVILDMAVDDFGRVYLAGPFEEFAGVPSTGIVRLTAQGEVDTTWVPNTRAFSYPTPSVSVQVRGDILYAFGAVGEVADSLPRGVAVTAIEEAPVFETTSFTFDFGGGWKWNALGYLYDGFYPFVYFFERGGWVYVVGRNENGFYFYHFGRQHWGWTGRTLYPFYVALDGPDAGAFLELEPDPEP